MGDGMNRPAAKYHVCHVRDEEGGYMVARERADGVDYWDDQRREWVTFPAGTRFGREREAKRLKEGFAAESEG